MKISKEMILFIGVFLAVVLTGCLALPYFHFEDQRISFLTGCALGIINVAALYFSWKQILEKKNLVLSGGVIVFKYPLLGFIIYEVVHLKQISLGWFLTGMASVFPAAIISLLFWASRKPKIKKEISLRVD